MTTLEWAEKEIELVSKKDDKTDNKAYEYAKSCYDSAMKAYKSLSNDEHSGYSWAITRQILTRLLKEKPLSAIEDKDDMWIEMSFGIPDKKVYQCTRMFSLFKYIDSNGTVTYSDNNRVICEGKNRFQLGLATTILDEIKPIKMPYYPSSEPIVIYTDEKSLHKDDDSDAIFLKYFFDPDIKNIVKINKGFVRKDGALLEITKKEYDNL